jgi:putative ABC transport system ATP-binding protein
LARALLRRPAVVLADEPTASLDDAACAGVLSLLRVSVSGSGTNWTITLPSSTNPTSLPGRYKLVIGGPSSGIESGGILMDVASEWYFDRI